VTVSPAPTETAYPFIHIEQRPDPDDPTGFQLDVKAGAGIDDTDHLVTVLLLVVENITGVSPGLYAKEIDMVRRIARGSGPMLVDLEDEDEG
jgi:hypothetical protein